MAATVSCILNWNDNLVAIFEAKIMFKRQSHDLKSNVMAYELITCFSILL